MKENQTPPKTGIARLRNFETGNNSSKGTGVNTRLRNLWNPDEGEKKQQQEVGNGGMSGYKSVWKVTFYKSGL